MSHNSLRKTRYGERNEHFFGHPGAGEPELPWRKWIRENLPRGPEGFVFEDIDGVAVRFDPRTHINQKFMLLEFKQWGVALDRSQLEVLKMLDARLRAGDRWVSQRSDPVYYGVYICEWHRTDEFVRLNYNHFLSYERLREFFLFQLWFPSYFESNAPGATQP